MIRLLPRKMGLLVIALFSLILPVTVTAQAQPVVYGVFFFSPTCPHCIDVLTNHWGSIQAEFGDQLRVLFIDATTPQGGQLMQDALTAMQIESRGVPMLIIGSDVLVGSTDIPLRAPLVIRQRLEAGGVGLPPIPGIEAIYQEALSRSQADQPDDTHVASAASTASQADQVSTDSTLASDLPPENAQALTLGDRVLSDPLANGAAILILVLLALSLLLVLLSAVRAAPQPRDPAGGRGSATRLQRVALGLVSVLGLALALSLVAGSSGDLLVLLLSGGELIIFLVVVGTLLRRPAALPNGLVPLAALGGLAVAAYLAYVELTLSEAVCGVVGSCNTVQQSEYARVFGVPIGVIGVAGYLLMIGLWLVSRVGGWQVQVRKVLQGMALFGVAFSIYLTFLEPFVIGATCVWCLTSALIMLLLLWLLTPSESSGANANSALHVGT